MGVQNNKMRVKHGQMTSGTFTKHTGSKNNFLDKLKNLYLRQTEGIMWAFKKNKMRVKHGQMTSGTLIKHSGSKNIFLN